MNHKSAYLITAGLIGLLLVFSQVLAAPAPAQTDNTGSANPSISVFRPGMDEDAPVEKDPEDRFSTAEEMP